MQQIQNQPISIHNSLKKPDEHGAARITQKQKQIKKPTTGDQLNRAVTKNKQQQAITRKVPTA